MSACHYIPQCLGGCGDFGKFWEVFGNCLGEVISTCSGPRFLDWGFGKPPTSSVGYADQMRADFHAFNMTDGVNGACVRARQATLGEVGDCFLGEHTLPFLKTPTFLLQSMVDSWQLSWVLGETQAVDTVNLFRKNATSRVLDGLYTAGGSSRIGGFFDSCVHHCGLWSELVVEGTRKVDAVTKWYEALMLAETAEAGEKTVWWQAEEFPCPSCCGGGSTRDSMTGWLPVGVEATKNPVVQSAVVQEEEVHV